MKRLAIATTTLAVLALLVLAVLRARASRELILETNGLPLANLKGEMMPAGVAGSPLVPTSTDSQGRLDLSGVPRAAEQINVSLWDGDRNSPVRNVLIQLPTSGFRMIVDFRGSRTVRTTNTIYVDLGFFEFKRQQVETWDQVTKGGDP